MLHHKYCASIHVASRGLTENRPFFEDMLADALMGAQINDSFEYTSEGLHYKKSLQKLSVEDFDLVFMRLPRPVSDEFLEWLSTTFSHATMINNPKGIIETSSKEYLAQFPEVCPDMSLCYSIEAVKQEIKKHPIVLKPLKEYGGKGLLKIDGDKLDDGTAMHNTGQYLEGIKATIEKEGFLAMKFLKNVSQGDKRILVVGGKILAASLRLPAEGKWLCNIAQGGTSVPSEVTEDEIQMIERISPNLVKKGILIYGADTLVDDDGKRVLSEINTLSIGGFPQAEAQTGKPVIKTLLDKIFDYTTNNE